MSSPRICIGNQTAFSAANLFEPFEYAVANGFDAFEWFLDKKPGGGGWDDLDLPTALRAEIRSTAESRQIRLSVHARCLLNPLDPGSAPLLRREMDLAEQIGAVVVVLHLYAEQGCAAFANALLVPLEWAAAAHITIAIENTPEITPADFNQLFFELRKLDPPGLTYAGFCVDIGHANLCPATRNDYLRFLDELDVELPIAHLHLHENWGDADSHLTLFTGPSATRDSGIRGLVRRLKARAFSGSMILEQWPTPPTLLNRARQQLLQLWNEHALDTYVSKLPAR